MRQDRYPSRYSSRSVEVKGCVMNGKSHKGTDLEV